MAHHERTVSPQTSSSFTWSIPKRTGNRLQSHLSKAPLQVVAGGTNSTTVSQGRVQFIRSDHHRKKEVVAEEDNEKKENRSADHSETSQGAAARMWAWMQDVVMEEA